MRARPDRAEWKLIQLASSCGSKSSFTKEMMASKAWPAFTEPGVRFLRTQPAARNKLTQRSSSRAALSMARQDRCFNWKEKASLFVMHCTQICNPAVRLRASAIHKGPVCFVKAAPPPSWAASDSCFPDYMLKMGGCSYSY